MAIIEVTENKKQYLDLLLLADEQEDMIDRYLDKGRMYVLDDNGVKHCGKQRLINDNYASADYIDFPKRPSKEIDYMNDEDAKKFYAAADTYPDIRYKTAAMILLLTGMRRGELCGLEWSNIDFKEATITIERSVTTVAGVGVVDKEPKTESSKRVIAISDKLLSVLTEYKVWYDQYRFDMGDQWKETDRLFIAECGTQIYPGTVYTWVHKVCDAAGLPHRTVHSLRHTPTSPCRLQPAYRWSQWPVEQDTREQAPQRISTATS